MTHDPTQPGRDSLTDYETEQFAYDLESAVRSLKQAAGQPGGLAGPATVYGVLDAVHTAASSLDQLLLQLERFLIRQHMDGRLVRDHGASLDEALEAFSRAILHARHQGAGCTEAVNQARSAINHVHSGGLPPGGGTTPSHDTAAEPAPTAALRQAEPRARHPKNGRPRARWFGGPRKGAGA
ncbi:hypothetical protein [Actinomadura bangladeshensis]|uniref:Uncharacterized protein n=1 Tax=Actinomadura bangladeshensis TaxID=453573 RepID=A0A4R4P2Y7_9ACTN|nr:hypothetical protein [Actinomadura bangladeshensis]TDC15083.1 hypothetical protein E1284_16300 [Actinomadura bangladeshensis]